jgi:excisionase family DNA binding protein
MVEEYIQMRWSGTLLKAVDVAEKLNISKSLAYHLMQKGDIATVRIGRNVRVLQSDLEEFITHNRTSSINVC